MDLLIIIILAIMTFMQYYLVQQASKYLNPNFNKMIGIGLSKFRFSVKKKDYIDEKGIKFRNYWLINEIIKNTLFFSWLVYNIIMTFFVK